MPLNPSLYNRLAEIFGKVTIGDEGCAQIGHVTPYIDAFGRDKPQYRVDFAGENYNVDCPFCGQVQDRDTRHRLQINHTWGVPEQHTGNRRWFLAHCFHNNCMTSDRELKGFDNQRRLKSMVYGGVLPTVKAVDPAAARVEVTTAVTMPGQCVRLDMLPYEHPANFYLATRGFDGPALGYWWGVAYCVQADEYGISGRLIIPMFSKGVLVGWTARYLGEADWSHMPKYLNGRGSHLRQHVYGLEHAAQSPRLIIVEGVTSVWRLGAGTVALCGKKATARQIAAIVDACRELRWTDGNGDRCVRPAKPVYICLDGESDKGATTRGEAATLRSDLAKEHVPVKVVTLPPLTQPDGLALRGHFWPLLDRAG